MAVTDCNCSFIVAELQLQNWALLEFNLENFKNSCPKNESYLRAIPGRCFFFFEDFVAHYLAICNPISKGGEEQKGGKERTEEK